MRGSTRFEKPTIDQLGKFHDMVRKEQMHHDLFQFFLEDPWRILDSVDLRSLKACDMPSLDSAMVVSNLKLDEHLRNEDIPWKPELNNERGEKFALLRLRTLEGQWSVKAVKMLLGASELMPGTLLDLFRLAQWNEVFSWELPVIALGTPIEREVMGRLGIYYPALVCRTLLVVSAEGFEAREHGKRFCLGRVKM